MIPATVKTRHVMLAISRVWPTTADRLRGKDRRRDEVIPRQMVMALARDFQRPLTEIGNALDRDHTTVLHGVRSEEKRHEDALYRLQYDEAKREAQHLASLEAVSVERRRVEIREIEAQLTAN